jgi:hypothetical protein
MARDGRRLFETFMKREYMLHDILRSDALGEGGSVGGMHRSLTKLFSFHELLRVLPDLSSMGTKREPQTDEV